MKIKTIATGKNRKQLKKMLLDMNIELEMIKIEKLIAAKKVAEYITRANLLERRLEIAKRDSDDLRQNVNKETSTNIELAKENYELKKEKVMLEDKVNLFELSLQSKNSEILSLRLKLSGIEADNQNLKAELDKPWWKKVFRC